MSSLDALQAVSNGGEENAEQPDPVCNGCKLQLEESNDTVVVSLGNSLWHVDCTRRTSSSSRMVLPVCDNCSYICCVCNLPINNEAIVTGDESYHAECFRCKSCQQRMDELIFAKTARGIYCMPCHNERVARSRKAEAKKRGQKEKSSRVRTPNSATTSYPDTPLSTHMLPNSSASTNGYSPIQTPNGTFESFTLLPNPKPSVPDLPPSMSSSPPDPRRPKTAPDRDANGGLARPQLGGRGQSSTSTNGSGSAGQDGYATSSSSPALVNGSGSGNGMNGPNIIVRASEEDHAPLPSSSVTAGLERRINGPRRPNFGGVAVHQRQHSSSSDRDREREREDSSSLAPSKQSSRAANRRSGFYGAGSMEESVGQAAVQGRDRSMSEPGKALMDSIAETEGGTIESDSTEAPLTPPNQLQNQYTNLQINLDSSPPSIPNMHNSISFYDPDILVFLDAVHDPDSAFGNSPKTPKAVKKDQSQELGRTKDGSGPIVQPKTMVMSPVEMERGASAGTEETIERLADDEEDDPELVEKVRSAMGRKRAGETVEIDAGLVEKLLGQLGESKRSLNEVQGKYNEFRRASRTAFEGFSMAREEYDKEVASRKEMESLIIRLQQRLAEQAGQLAKLDKVHRDSDAIQRRSKELRHSVNQMGDELSRLRMERDMTVAEMEELADQGKDSRPETSLAARLDDIKEQYRLEIMELVEERNRLHEEVEELRQTRDVFAEETANLNTRNVELSEQNMDASRKLDDAREALNRLQIQGAPLLRTTTSDEATTPSSLRPSNYDTASIPSPASSSQAPINAAVARNRGKPMESDNVPTFRKKKNWLTGKAAPDPRTNGSVAKPAVAPLQQQRNNSNEYGTRQHAWQQTSILRPVRCEFCGDKMWGLQEYRCAACGSYCHAKCTSAFTSPCGSLSNGAPESEATSEPAAPSLFGNDLTTQAILEDRPIPTIITKCIAAVEAIGMEYEGIYRKTGGSAQTKLVTACFEKGEPFDLEDSDRFNDIAAVTSAFKNYLRSLPIPLFTFEHHESFMAVATMSEADGRTEVLEKLLHMLPEIHFNTVKFIMTHLHRVHLASEENKMTSSNLGVVFGPTLLRSSNPAREFSDMGSKAKIVEVLVENAVQLFSQPYQSFF
ncbi:RhoGAP-domain-containing protein [Atractiella rhizophila]|nr:RhoGAP-domain-containing protein [Atractiella rhizophila]